MLDRPVRNGQIRPNAATRTDAGPIVTRRRGRLGPAPVFGGLLLGAAALVVVSAGLSTLGAKGANYVVAARPLAAGTVIGPGDTTTAKVGLTGASRGSAFRQPAVIVGRALAVPADPGELIESSMLAPANGIQLRPVSIAVETDSVSELEAGEQVDVLTVPSPTTGTTSGSNPTVTVVVRGATLLMVDRSGGG